MSAPHAQSVFGYNSSHTPSVRRFQTRHACCVLRYRFPCTPSIFLSVPHGRYVLRYNSSHSPSVRHFQRVMHARYVLGYSSLHTPSVSLSAPHARCILGYSFVALAVRSAFSECDTCTVCSRDSSPHTQSVLLSAPHARCVLMVKNPNLHIRAPSPDSDTGCCTPPHQTENIPLSRLHPLPNGNVGWSTTYHPVSASPTKQRREHFVDADGMPELPENNVDDVERLPPTGDPDPCDTSWMDFAYLENLAETVVSPRRRRPADNPLLCWIQDRDTFVAEDIRWDGLGDYTMMECPCCGIHPPKFRCEECDGGQLLCKACLVEKHAQLCLHRIEVSER
ncbi:hypothetical protein Hypma_000434 [Hypsizygus marmoreus]|uniref:Uncharacterized protein n=1 Tax=Hypsizygus marmoreus TaxID=39966 RepID=A0A369JCF2_HYPMA|nr:hypothetical protein Hypma_000434 [Hypsizygus marmoreus]